MNQQSVMRMMKSIVLITHFNKCEAAKILEEVEAAGMKIVTKNNQPVCVLLSPSQYESLMEMLSDFVLHDEAEKRMDQNDDSENISHKDMMKELGVSQIELDDLDVEIE